MDAISPLRGSVLRANLQLALLGHAVMSDLSPISGVERKSRSRAGRTAFDPLQTSDVHPNILPSTGLDAFQVSRLGSYTGAIGDISLD